ncbi:hypothetical protein R1flu_018152 [Riccia fluitans]|uniref:DNA replication complex GINS protein PSF2 n=1 Tax=Riccia fluitans TaxID=41844 RepID=A0ABD1ZF04_9MARC
MFIHSALGSTEIALLDKSTSRDRLWNRTPLSSLSGITEQRAELCTWDRLLILGRTAELIVQPARNSMAGRASTELESSLFSGAEVEFLAEDDMVVIVPSLRMDTLHLICGDFGPFMPQVPTSVPLWLGIAMKKRGKCRLRAPEWMSVENLTQVLELERESPQEFQPLPFHYVEVSRLLLDNARDDLIDVYMVQTLIEDIRNVRFHKVQSGLQNLSGKTHAVKLKNLAAMEVSLIRPFFVRALEKFYLHDDEELVQPSQTETDTPLASVDRLSRRVLRPR